MTGNGRSALSFLSFLFFFTPRPHQKHLTTTCLPLPFLMASGPFDTFFLCLRDSFWSLRFLGRPSPSKRSSPFRTRWSWSKATMHSLLLRMHPYLKTERYLSLMLGSDMYFDTAATGVYKQSLVVLDKDPASFSYQLPLLSFLMALSWSENSGDLYLCLTLQTLL